MRLIDHSRYPLALVVAWLAATSASALTIDLEFTDSSNFYTNTTARNTIEQAAEDISDAITSALSPINQGTFYNSDVGTTQYKWERSRTSGSQTLTATYGWNYQYTDGATVMIPAETLAAHTIKIFVRGEALSGSTLGQGGPTGYNISRGYNLSYSGSISQPALQSQFSYLTDQMSGLLEGELTRNAGPVIGTLQGVTSIDFGNGLTASEDYEFTYGPAYGTLALDTSHTGTFSNYWHIDHATPVASGKRDLYSVALHEILHAIGVGASETWNELSSGTSWTGDEVIAEAGTGANMVTGGHVAHGKTGKNIYTGATQEAVMDPTLNVGTRKYLTTLDLAFLRDLGYSTITPEFGIPGDFNDDGIVNLADYVLWRNNLGAGNEAAINFHGNGGGITSADYTIWKDNFGNLQAAGSFSSPSLVPEPHAALLACLGLGMGWWLSGRTRQAVRG
ncbi:hypothetical protein [Aeoliella sp.]|uniref:hypothetical protein n=1 Tax=Aeoliella sp. TaxID=2795800 RepID=UPI003CCC276D